VASALNNSKQPEIKKSFCSLPVVLQNKTIKFDTMKKIFTLALGLMFTIAMFAADHRPTVSVTASRKYEIVIDGRHYRTNGNTINISTLFNGRHNVKVFEVRGGFFGSKRLISSSNFMLRNSDVQIKVDRFGQVQIRESRFGRGWNDHDWNDRTYDRDGRNSGYDRSYPDRRF